MAFQKETCMEVEITSTKFIKPASPTPNHLQNYKLSFFDQIADLAHLPFVLFYPPPTNNTYNYSIHEQEQFEQSLSRVLTHVYPIAGRLSDDDSISCQDQGVKFVKAKINSKLNEFLEKAHKDVNLALLCWPQDTWNVDESNLFTLPIVIVQITEFECGGLALSMSHAHLAMDGYSTFNIINEWSKVCRMKIPVEKIDFMSFNLAHVFPPRDLSKLLLPRIPKEDRVDSRVVAKRLYINEDSISRLREQIGELCFNPSRVEMIIALLWRAFIRASEKKNGHLKRSRMGVPVNLRTRLISLPQLAKSFGNLIIEAPVKFVPGVHNKMPELNELVTLIRDTVKETITACDKSSPEDVVSAVANIYNESFLSQEWGNSTDEVDEYTSSSLCRFPIQEADFGWGKPCLMHFGSRDGEFCWLYDAECGNGICVQLDLKEVNMHHLFELCHTDINDFFQF
ncbi:vinorine synthase-like [Solanum dulcamara]|uniref:vinorine synthase-like n=1 Tax=Solanum dulcamara TaxID=45834 RepID=UPI002485DA49|nr:vinorine synthase-like [Solanum dulcamara]